MIPGAQVTITDIATNQTEAAKSDANGNFRFVQLLPGNYKVTVEKGGFERFQVASEQVATGEASKVNAAMSIGVQNQTVEVTTQAALLQTQSSSLSYGVEQRQVEALPLNGRNVLNMEELVPGVVPQGGTINNGNPGNTSGNYQIGGGTANQSATYVDGAPVNYSYVSITKALTFHDRYAFHATVEAYNIFNWTQFAPPNEQADSNAFGVVNAQYNQPRILQFSGRFTF